MAPSFLRQLQPIRIHIGNHDIAGSGMLRDRGRHGADRAGAGDQHVFAQHRERQGRMHRVAERIENGRDVAIDGRIVQPDIGHGQRDVLGKRAGPIHADPLGVLAEMPAASQAVAAAAADHMPFAADNVAGSEIDHIRADRDDLAHELVADHHGHGNRALGPGVPVVDMHVGAADPGASHANQDVIDAVLRLGNIFQPQPGGPFTFHQRLHDCSTREETGPRAQLGNSPLGHAREVQVANNATLQIPWRWSKPGRLNCGPCVPDPAPTGLASDPA